jgi:hypothetical protein
MIECHTPTNALTIYSNYTIIIPTKCTSFLLLKSQDITVRNFVLYFCPYMFQPAWVIFRGLNGSAWLKLLLNAHQPAEITRVTCNNNLLIILT